MVYQALRVWLWIIFGNRYEIDENVTFDIGLVFPREILTKYCALIFFQTMLSLVGIVLL